MAKVHDNLRELGRQGALLFAETISTGGRLKLHATTYPAKRV